MPRKRWISQVLVVSAAILALDLSARAQSSRTFVATTGDDSNTSVNCSATANCRSFAAALSVTNPGGEIVVVTSGGYGPATIGQPVVIAAIGVDASISAANAGDGLDINTSGNVTLIGLNLYGQGNGGAGVAINAVGILRLYNIRIDTFTNGILCSSSARLSIYNSEIDNNAGSGLLLNNSSASAYVQGSSFENNGGAGVIVESGHATVADSDAGYNGIGFYANTGTLTLVNDESIFNTYGLITASGGVLYFDDCIIAGNTNAYQVGSGTTMTGTGPGTNLITPGQILSGTLGAASTLQ